MTNAIDKLNYRQAFLDFPDQFKKALELSKDVKVTKEINKIIVSGLGGSGWPADLVKTYLSEELKIPFEVNRDYFIPFPVDEKSLVFITSFSGNTEETISSYYDAKSKRAQFVIITCNGELEKISKEDNVPLVKIIKESENFQPRVATGYMFTSIVNILANSGIISDKSKEIIEMAQVLKKTDQEEQGRQLAKRLANKTPIIYLPDKYKALGYVWKIKFNENAKTMAFCNYFSELNHNELSGYINSKGLFYTVILRDKNDHPQILKRMEVTAEIIKEKGGKVEIIDMKGENILTKIFTTAMLGDWTSYYLALEYKENPALVNLQEEFKDRIKS